MATLNITVNSAQAKTGIDDLTQHALSQAARIKSAFEDTLKNAFSANGASEFIRKIDDLTNSINRLNTALGNSSSKINSLNNQYRSQADEINEVGKAHENAGKKAESSSGGMLLSTMKVTASYMAMRAAIRGVVGAIEEGLEFENTMKLTALAIGATKDETIALEKEVRKLASTSIFAASEVTEAIKALALAGLSASEALTALPSVLNLAFIGEIDLEKAAATATNTMNAMKLTVQDLERVVDVFAATSIKTTASVQTLTEAMKYAAPIAGTLGYSIEEVTAMLGVLAQAGINGGQAGRVLQQAFVKAEIAAKEFGMEGAGLIEILEEVNKRQLSTVEINKMFGLVALKGVLVLKDSIDAYRELTTELENTEGATANLVKSMETTTLSGLKMLKSAITEVFLSVYDVYKEDLSSAFQGTAKWLLENKESIVQFANELKAVFQIISDILKLLYPIVEAIKNIITVANELLKVFIGIGQVLTTPIRWFTGDEIPEESDFRWWKQLPKDIQAATEEVRVHEEAIKSLEIEYENFGESITNWLLGPVLSGQESFSDWFLGPMLSGGNIDIGNIFGDSAAYASELNDSYVKMWQTKKLINDMGISEKAILSEINPIIKDQISLWSKIKDQLPEVAKEFLVIDERMANMFGFVSINEDMESISNFFDAIGSLNDSFTDKVDETNKKIEEVYQGTTAVAIKEAYAQYTEMKKTIDLEITDREAANEAKRKLLLEFTTYVRDITAEAAAAELEGLNTVLSGLSGIADSASSIAVGYSSEMFDQVVSIMKEKYSKMLDAQQLADAQILNSAEDAKQIRLAREESFGKNLEAQALANMQKYVRAMSSASGSVADFDVSTEESNIKEDAKRKLEEFQNKLTSLTKTGSSERKRIINEEFDGYVAAAKEQGKSTIEIEKARSESLQNESDKVSKAYAKQQTSIDNAAESSRKYSEVIAEINSKIAAFEGDTYTSKMAKIEEQYLKYQKTLKGSSEELEKWRALAEKDINDKAAETIAQINREISEFKGEEADGYAESIEKINKKYAQFAKDVQEGSEELATWLQLATEAANLSSAGAGVYTPGTYSKWPRSESDIQKEAETISNTMRNMYKDLGETSSGYYTAEYELLKNQKDKYIEIVKDEDLVNKWYYNEKQKIRDKEILATDKFFDGMEVGYRKILEDQMTWAKAGKKVIEDFAKNGASAISTGLFDVITGQIENLEDVWKNLWQGMLKTMTDIVAQMAMNDLLKMLFGVQTSGGLTLSVIGGDQSATGTASSAMSLASLAKSLWELPETIASIGAFFGLSSATASTAAAGHAATSTAGAAVAMEKLAEASAGAAATIAASTGTTSAAVLGLGESASVAGTSLASSAHSLSSVMIESQLVEASAAGAAASSANLLGAIEGGLIAGIISFGANILPGLLGGGSDNIDIMYELKKWEAGYTNITKETADFYKTTLLNIDKRMTYIAEDGQEMFDWDKIYQWIADNQEFLKLTSSDIEKLIAQQADVYNKMDVNPFAAASTFLIEESKMRATVEVAIEIAQDAALPVLQKMYQLGFIANESGGWESEATIAMLAEFKNQGVAWEDINNSMIQYGATDADVYKRIYAEYHGDSVLTDLQSLTSALSAEGISEDIIKTIVYMYESNIPLAQMQKILEWNGLSSEEVTKIIGQIDPSDEWLDLVIPVDAPDSIPVSYTDMSQNGRASGGPVSAGTPYIIGEVGPELFVPQESGHILSNANMKKLMGMGVQGFADGTTDEWKDPFEWMDEINQNDSDNASEQSSKDTKTYESLSEWLDDYNEKLKEWLGTGNDLSDQLDDLNKFYEEQLGYANELSASRDQLDQLAKDQQAAKEKILQDWLDEEIDYYNQMMGLNTELGDSLKEISGHYDTAIEEATSAGATEEQLAEIRKAQMSVTEKALKDWLDNEIDYYNDAMGVSTQYGDALKEISDHYDEAIASAKAAGATEEQLAAIRQVQMAVTEKATKDWAKSTMSSMLDVWESMLKWAQDVAGMTEQQMALTSLMIYRAKKGFSANGFEDILNIDGMNSDQVEEYVDKLAEYANAVASALQATYEALKNVKDAIEQNIQDILNGSKSNEQLVNEYVQQIIEGWNALAGLSAEDMPEAIDDLREKVMKYYDLQKQLIEDKYAAEEDKFQDEIEMIKKIRDKIQELTYSSFNLALPNVKVATAGDDYAALLAAAQTGDKDAIERYMAFINTYLQSAQDAYKSSAKYQEIYNQVMEDLKNLDTQQGKTIEDLTEELNRLTEENTKKMQEELNALSKLTVEALKALGEKTDATMSDVVTQLKQIFDLLTAWVTAIYGGGASSAQSSSSTGYADGGIATGPYSGYTATLHGTEAIIPLRGGSVPVVISGGGYDDPETKALLKQLVVQGKQKQRVTLALDNGSELSGYIRAEADTVRVAANTRGGSGNRRLYR